MAISMLKIRRPLGRLIFNMGIAIPGKTVFLIETATWFCNQMIAKPGNKTAVYSWPDPYHQISWSVCLVLTGMIYFVCISQVLSRPKITYLWIWHGRIIQLLNVCQDSLCDINLCDLLSNTMIHGKVCSYHVLTLYQPSDVVRTC